MDPFEPLGRSSHPFCFFGFAPALFDAPARHSREDMHWRAETFLCFVPTDTDRREARAILGFTWGFRIREKAISSRPPAHLAAVEWDKHVAFCGESTRTGRSQAATVTTEDREPGPDACGGDGSGDNRARSAG
jgi:hypothetical protein